MNYTFTVNWIRPNGVTTNITDRCLLDQIGSLNRGIAAPDELQAFVSGDVSLQLDNQDAFFTADLKSSPTNPGTLQTFLSYIQVEIIRNGIRWFRGILLPWSIQLENFEKVANVVVLGPMRFCDLISAEQLQRTFSGSLQAASTAAEGSSTLSLSSSTAPIEVGDILGIGTDDVLTVAVASWSPTAAPNPVVTLVDPLTRTVSIGESVTVTTPYFRNQNITTLVPTLLALAGVVNYDVRFTGLVGTSSFTSNFNTLGASGSGAITSMQRVLSGGSERLMLLADAAASSTHSRLYASTVTSGFSLSSSIAVTAPSGYHNWADQGGLPGGGDPCGTDAQLFFKPFDWVDIKRIGTTAVYRTERHSYDVVRTVGGQTYLYELFFTQRVNDFNFPDYSGEPYYDVGGLDFSTSIRRYVTVDAGVNWTQDPNWVPSRPAPTLVTFGGGARTYQYVIVGLSAGGSPVGVTLAGVTNTGPNNLGVGAARISVTWLAMVGAFNYAVYRTANGGGVGGLGIIGFIVGLTVDDTGAVGANQVPQSANELLLASSTTYQGTGGAAEDQSIQVRPFITGAGYDHLIYANYFSGIAAPQVPLNIDRIQVNGNIAGLRGTIHFEAKGLRAILTKRYLNYSNVNRRVDLYFWDLSSAAPGVIHENDDGVGAPTGASAIYGIPGLLPQLRTLVWNQVEGVGSRVAMLFSSPQLDSGTGLLTLTPGTLFYAGTAEGIFSLEESIMLAPRQCLFFNTRPAPASPRLQVTTQNGYDAIVFGGASPSNTVAFVTAWNVAVGNAGTVNVWVVYTPWGFWLISRYHTGFIAYADFSEMSVSKALQELAFVVNAAVSIDWTAGGLPFGSFVSRDLPSPNPVKVLANLDGTKPSGAVQDLILSENYSRAWEQTFCYITITGQNDIVGEAGIKNAQQQTADLSARFIDTQSLADVVADSLFTFYGPAWPPMASPVVVPQGVLVGGQVYGYQVIANNNLDPRVGIVAYSGETRIGNGALALTGINFNQLSFSTVSGATRYHIFRTASSSASSPSSLLGYLGSTVVVSFPDTGLTPAVGVTQPPRIRQPRQAAEIEVIDDGTNYRPRDEVQFPDLLGHTDLGDPNRIPVAPPDPSKPPRWWIESIDTNPTDPVIHLMVVEKDVPS